MSKIPAINEIDANSPSQESTEVVVKATTVTPDINEIQETISASATIQEIDGTRKPTISEIYKIVNDGLFESTTNWWDYAYKLSQAQINQDIISRLDNGVIGGGYSKGVDIITITSNKVPSNTNVYSALKSDSLYPKKLNNEDINGIYDFLNGLTIGKPTAYTGGTWSVDKLGKTHLTTDYLYVRLKAIFETLQILNVDTIGGKLVISPAGSIRVAYVDRIKIDAPVFKHDEKTDVWSIPQIKDDKGNLVNETLNQEVYRCYFLGEQEGEKIENKWKVGDQAQAKSFNVKKGTYHKTGNHYLWRLVVGVSTDTVDIDGKKYHYVDLSQLIFDVGSDAPAPGDVLNQLGHKGEDLQRQTAIVLNAVDNYAPSITLYAGINDFTLLNKEYVDYGVYQGKAFFNVYGDMYVGDKGANPKTYIKFKNGKIDIKANLTIGSSIDGKDLDKYIKENGGVDEKTVISLINNSQVIKDLQNQADGAIETWFYEGEPTLKNLPAVDWTTNEIKKIHVGDLYYDQITGYAYRFTKYNDDVKPYDWNRIKDNDVVKALEAANKAQATADSKMKIFYGETKPTNYQAGDMWVNATLAGKFDNDIARSTTTSKTFNADHWVLASRYSEAIQTLLNWSNQYTTKFEDLTKIVKEQKDQSITNWFYDYEPTDANAPANLWNTEELRKEHIGDIFYDTKNNHSYRWTGSAWSMIKDADFDEAMKKAKDAEDLADKKRQIFYSDTTPTGADRGDLWMKQVGNKTEVWVFDGTNWVKSNDKALADYSEAINKELEGIKGQLDGKAETWYQADDPSTNWTNKTSHEGDIWYNTTDGTTQYWNGTAWEKMDIPKDVFDTIDGKSSIFVDSYADAKAGKGVISKGYNERDIWILPADAIVNGVQYYKGDILTATADRTEFNEKDWTKKVRYVGDKELTNAIDKVNKKINDISATTLPGLNDKFNEFAKDGIIDSSEKARLTDLLNQANNEVLSVNDQITSIIKSDYLTNDNANKGKLIEAQKTLSIAWTEYKTLIDTLIASENPITKNNIAEASTKYTNLQNSIKAVKQYLAACQADILSNIGIDINSYKYLKEAFKGKTEINGGLVVTNVLQLRQTSDVNSPITAGISGLQGKADENGVVDKDTYDITSIAAWFGGPMVDKNIFTDEQLKNKVAGTDYARSLFRHDGSGYLSSGAIYWGTDGILHGNPNSFILQGTSLATMFNYIRLFYLHYANTNDEGITGVDYITPTKPFSRLDILAQGGTEAGLNLPTGLFIGNATTGGSFQVGNVIIRTKDGDPNILEIVSATNGKTANLGVQGGVSAYGTYTASTGGGGGLNASVVSYTNIISGNYNDSDLTTIPNAYSIKALSNRIDNIATELGGLNLSWNNITGKPSTFPPSAHTHKWAEITDHITKVSQLINDKSYALTSQIPTTLPANGGNADTVGGKHLIKDGSGPGIKQVYYFSIQGQNTSYIKLGTLPTVSVTGIGTSKVMFTVKGGINFGGTNESVYEVAASTRGSIQVTSTLVRGNRELKFGYVSTSSNVEIWMAYDGTYRGVTEIEVSSSVCFTLTMTETKTKPSGFVEGSYRILAATTDNVASATKLQTARNLWGNLFDGTSDINGSIIVPSGKYISIGNIKMEYDVTNKALKITNTMTNEVANFYTSGGISAYGVGTSSSSGGGLNGSVKAYTDAIRLTTENLSEIASAYSIKALNSRISNLENGSATTISVSGSGNAVTSITKNGTTISVVKDSTFLTSHQSLSAYLKSADAANTYSKIGHTHSYAGSASAGGDATRALKLKDYNGLIDIYCGYTGESLTASNMKYVVGIKVENNAAYYKDVSKGELQKWLGLGARAYDNTSYLPITGGTLTGNLNGTTAVFCGRINNSGDDEGILIKKSSNGLAGLILGGTTGNRAVLYLSSANSFWRFVKDGTAFSDIVHPNKSGTIALTSDIPTKVSSLSNDSGYITSSDSCAYATSAGNADTVDDVHVTWAGSITHTDWLAVWENSTTIRCLAPASLKLSQLTDDILKGKYLPLSGGNMNVGARISANNGDLYIGNSNNNGWVFMQDIASQTRNKEWLIKQNGTAKFRNIYIASKDKSFNQATNVIEAFDEPLCFNWFSTANINLCHGGGNVNIYNNLSVNGLITNQGILPANSGFNDKGNNCIVSADALCSGITAITDSIPVDKVTIQYSNNNGSSWNNLNITNDNKFKMYTNSAGINTIYLGNNFISGSTNAEKLSQVKKNELMFSFYFPDNCYSQIYFACVDISNGVNTTCTVEIVRENGEIADTYTKEMFGWNKFNYINFASTDGNDYLSAGTSYRRVVRFRFKHNQNTTELRNACINKIRIFAFTKFSFPTDRFMGHTGHIYNFDYNMNTYFPNSVVAKGGVTAYQSSDIRLKTNIAKVNCLKVIKSIGGTYEFDYIRDNKHSIGFIAQNVNNPLLKDIVAKDDDGYLKINYWNPKLISLAFGALTEIDDEVDKLKARVTYLESEVERLINTCA